MQYPIAPFPETVSGYSLSQTDMYIVRTYLNAALVAAINDLAARVTALEAALGPVTVLNITAEQEAVLAGVPLGSVVELRGPTTVHTLTVGS